MLKPGMQEIKLGTHSGIFHADDVLCATLVETIMRPKRFSVFRTRDPHILNKCNFVLDVGCKDEVTNTRVCFDHHQEVTNAKDYYENGVKKAACGKLFEWMWDQGYFQKHYKIYDFNDILQDKIKNKLLEKIFYPVESMDNGQSIKELENNKFTFVHSMIPAYNNQSDDILKERFLKLVTISKEILNNLVEVIIEECKASETVINLIRYSKDSEILILSDYFPWMDTVINYNKNPFGKIKKLIIFKDLSNEYRIQTVPTGDPDNKFLSLVDLPEEWAGKRGEDLEKVSGIKGAVFCHPGRFIAGWKTLDGAIAAANKALER